MPWILSPERCLHPVYLSCILCIFHIWVAGRGYERPARVFVHPSRVLYGHRGISGHCTGIRTWVNSSAPCGPGVPSGLVYDGQRGTAWQEFNAINSHPQVLSDSVWQVGHIFMLRGIGPGHPGSGPVCRGLQEVPVAGMSGESDPPAKRQRKTGSGTRGTGDGLITHPVHGPGRLSDHAPVCTILTSRQP